MNKKNNFLYQKPDKITDSSYCHADNVVKCAARVVKKLVNFSEVIVVAPMQSGKTEVMKRLIYLINNYNAKIKLLDVEIDRYNIYVVVCASSINLKKQHQDKLPEIKNKIYHLNDIQKLLKSSSDDLIQMVDSSLIIFDECHCDAEQKKLIDRFRKLLEYTATQNKTFYHVVGFSATPYEQVAAGYPMVIMKPGPGYYGIKDMFRSHFSSDPKIMPTIFQAKDLRDTSECIDLFSQINLHNYYYIFRLPNRQDDEKKVIDNICREIKSRKIRFDSIIYDMHHSQNINYLLQQKPIKPTIIYIKNKLRLGESLDTTNVYMVHDNYKSMFTHTVVQSLLGRCCGYNKKSHGVIIYCDYEKADNHYRWMKKNYNINYLPCNAKYIKNDGCTKDICIY